MCAVSWHTLEALAFKLLFITSELIQQAVIYLLCTKKEQQDWHYIIIICYLIKSLGDQEGGSLI